MIHRIERGLGPRCHNRNRRQRHKHAFHVKQQLHTSLLHHSHHSNRSSTTHRPHKSRLEPVTTLALFHVKHSAPVPTGARTRKRETMHQPRTNRAPTTTDNKRGATPRQHPAQSVTNAHTWAPLTHSPAPQLHEGARAPPSSQAHGAHKPFTPASRAGSARGPRASARRPRRARSTR